MNIHRDPHFERAHVLIEQSRYEMAAEELRQTLAADPDHAEAHAWLGICLSEMGEMSGAVDECKQAVFLGPDQPTAHYALGFVLNRADHVTEAQAAAERAIALDPSEPHYHALLAMILLNRKQWQAALEAAERGLEIDGEHVDCLNWRAIALTKLGRRDEAGEAIDIALKRSPEDAHSHANMGWTKLHNGEPHAAMEHFKEALRLEPNMEWARAGIVEAMKARNPLYRLLLRFFLWMSTLSAQTQWMLIIGLIIGVNVVANIPTENLALALAINVVILGYVLFVMLSWMGDSLFNFILRLDRYGRLALSDEQRTDSTLMMLGVLYVAGLFGATLYLLGSEWMGAAVNYVFTLLAIAVTINAPRGRNRWILAGATLIILGAATGQLYMLWHYVVGPGAELELSEEESRRIGNTMQQLRNVFIWGSVLMTWIGPAMYHRRR